jgi:hypothetical protein
LVVLVHVPLRILLTGSLHLFLSFSGLVCAFF